jgi:hypothetical protein
LVLGVARQELHEEDAHELKEAAEEGDLPHAVEVAWRWEERKGERDGESEEGKERKSGERKGSRRKGSKEGGGEERLTGRDSLAVDVPDTEKK